jgi:hypothetical protein
MNLSLDYLLTLFFIWRFGTGIFFFSGAWNLRLMFWLSRLTMKFFICTVGIERSSWRITLNVRPLSLISSYLLTSQGSRDSSVGIATIYGLDGTGIESWWVEIFRTRPDRPWGPPSPLYNGYRVFPRGKAAGAWCWPPTPIHSAKVLKYGRTIPLLALRALVACIGTTFTFLTWSQENLLTNKMCASVSVESFVWLLS